MNKRHLRIHCIAAEAYI